MEYRVISADDHIDMQWLPKDLWQARAPQAWRERAPRVVDTADEPYWVCGDSTWPESRQAIEENFKGVAAGTRRRILCDNAKALYGL